MSAIGVEDIIAQVNQLPAKEREKLIAKLNQEIETEYVVPEGRLIRTDAPFIDRTQEFEWLKQHEREYFGQWIALMGDQLVAHGTVAKEVFAKARERGYPRAMFILVEAVSEAEQEARSKIPPGRIISINAPYIDRTQEYEWMKQHEREYIGQWVALKGGRLIAHGAIAKEVFAKTRELGAPDALVYLVENPNLHYMGF